MTVSLITAPPAGGKTQYCIEKILGIRAADPFAPVRVIVSDKLQMAYWKRRLAAVRGKNGQAGGVIGLEVISFAKLAMQILEASAESPLPVQSRLDSLCLAEAAGRAASERPFEYFGPILGKAGVLPLFEKTLRELQRRCILPEDLERYGAGDPKLADTTRVYREYLMLMRERGWIGNAGLLTAAADALEQGTAGDFRCPLLVVDGFDELTEDCLRLLNALSPECKEILITLPELSGADGGRSASSDEQIGRAHV